MKSFQIRSFFWSVFSCNRTRKNFVFGHFSRSDSRFSFSYRNCFRITLLKICKFCTWSYFPILLGTHRSCSSILVFDVIALWIAISLSHIFYLAFAASNNFMTRANLKEKCEPLNIQTQPPRGVRRKRCSKNIQQIYQRTPMSKCNFNKNALQLYWNHNSAWVVSCKFAAYFQNTFS